MSEPTAFDPFDPADQIADMLRKQTVEMVMKLDPDQRYQQLAPHVRIECLVAGILTGLVGAAFAHIEDGGRDAIMEFIADCLPAARIQAEGIERNQVQ